MAKFLANENVPEEIVQAARASGHDLVWIKDVSPGAKDDAVLARALAENRVLLTFDKDFGDMVFHQGKTASPGIILLRPRLRSPQFLVQFVTNVLSQSVSWEGHFCQAREGQLRVTPLPEV